MLPLPPLASVTLERGAGVAPTQRDWLAAILPATRAGVTVMVTVLVGAAGQVPERTWRRK